MSVGYGFKQSRAVFGLVSALLLGACTGDGPVDARDADSANSGSDDQTAGDDRQDSDDDATPSASKDASTRKVDAGRTADAALAGGARPTADAKDASVAKAPDAGSGTTRLPEGGTSGSSVDSGAASAADAGPLCSLKRYQPSGDWRAPEGQDFPVLEVNGGEKVSAVGCAQQWEGIVLTMGGRGLCTAAFITERHLISASHCYASDGAVSLKVSAPTWDNGVNHSFQAQVKRSGGNMSLDVSIIDLGVPVDWATPDRRYVLHAGKATAADLHLYGFGSGGSSGAAGTLRGIPNRATLRVTDNGRGNLIGVAGPAQLCQGDSGGPAFVEKTAPVLYGINQAIVPPARGGTGTCAKADWSIMFTNVSAYLPFVEMALGKQCERKRVDDMDVAQCW